MFTCLFLFTCQPVIDLVVLVPQPQDLLLVALHLLHVSRRRLFKMASTFLAAEEGADVATHHLQHRRRPLQTRVVQRRGRGLVLDCQDVEQRPQAARVTSQTRFATLATNPAKLRPQEHTCDLTRDTVGFKRDDFC